MIVFHSDLDHTLIYSYKHDIGQKKICVEWYHGREASFMTEKSRTLLQEIRKKMLFVPTTTRTEEQYRRITLGTEEPEYALVCNGGVLLERGKENAAWYQESLRLAEPCREALKKAEQCMREDPARTFEVRNIRELFLFTKSEKPEQSVQRLRAALDGSGMEVFQNGVKVYAVPKELDKGTAVRRFGKKMRADQVFAAGDSRFDLPMLAAATTGIAPESLAETEKLGKHIVVMGKEEVFSDALLGYLWKQAAVQPKS